MISLKKYWDATTQPAPQEIRGVEARRKPKESGILGPAVSAYRSALQEIGSYSIRACPALGDGLKKSLGALDDKLSNDTSPSAFESADESVKEQLQDWGRRTAGHYQQKTNEVKELLLMMARTASSVGERDQRCSGQISEVTARLKNIACLEDISEIRSSIEKSAVDLKSSLDRMEAEGRQAIALLRAEVSTYQTRLEEAEELASRDALTGLRNRAWVEHQIEHRIASGGTLSVAIVDIDDFKQVNDAHGHVVGDELLQQFAGELRSACRKTDVLGRWGGDEFILVLNSRAEEAEAQISRLRDWVCGSYQVHGKTGPMKLQVEASIGVGEHVAGETMRDLLARADSAMYDRKPAARTPQNGTRR